MNLARKRGCRELSLGLALLLPGVIPCFGQLNATSSGTVSEGTGATIPGTARFVNSTVPAPGFRAQQIRELIGLIDVAPTLLEAAGVPVPSTWKGRSFLPLLDDPKARQSWPNQQLIQISESMTGRVIRTQDWTVADITSATKSSAKAYNEYQFYDQGGDPNELVNLAGRKVVAALVLTLKSNLSGSMGHRVSFILDSRQV